MPFLGLRKPPAVPVVLTTSFLTIQFIVVYKYLQSIGCCVFEGETL